MPKNYVTKTDKHIELFGQPLFISEVILYSGFEKSNSRKRTFKNSFRIKRKQKVKIM